LPLACPSSAAGASAIIYKLAFFFLISFFAALALAFSAAAFADA